MIGPRLAGGALRWGRGLGLMVQNWLQAGVGEGSRPVGVRPPGERRREGARGWRGVCGGVSGGVEV